jgi:hypothetical protein
LPWQGAKLTELDGVKMIKRLACIPVMLLLGCRDAKPVAPTSTETSAVKSNSKDGERKDKKKEDAMNQESCKLAAFALEVAPFEYHFSMSPDRGITFGYKGTNGARGTTYLMAPHDPRVPEIVEAVEQLIERHRLLATPMTNPDAAFKNRDEPSVHVYIMLAGGAGWKSCFTSGKVPPNVQAFIDATRALESRFRP